MSEQAIVLNELTKHYGKHRGINNLSFSVNQGEFFGFIGPNGAGKSTTIRTLMGLIRPTGGSASIFDLTKPHTRKTIYWAKAFTVFFGVVVVSMVYLLASFLALALFRSGIDWGEFFLIALSLMLVTLFLAAMGLLVGILFSRNRSPLLTAGLIVFVEYCVTSFSNIVSNRAISFLSPYSFFSAAEISKSGFYELDYLGWCVLLFALFLVLSYRVFLKKDIQFRS